MLRPDTTFAIALALCGCATGGGQPAPAHPHPSPAPASSHAAALDQVVAVHGAAGPWAVAGYRMAEFALRELALPRGSFDLAIVHFTPPEVQYSCIADGAAAATGASLGKLNLALADAPRDGVRTVNIRRSDGRTVTLRLTASFAARFADLPRDRLADAGRKVMQRRGTPPR